MSKYNRRIIKKAVHFNFLANKHTGATLLDEIQTKEQWDVMRAVLSASKVPKAITISIRNILSRRKVLKRKLHLYRCEDYVMNLLKKRKFNTMYKLHSDSVIQALEQDSD